MEEEEENEDSQDLLEKLPLKDKIEKSPTKLAEHLSRYKIITKDMVLKILTKKSKTRTDVDNRIIADYLSKNFEYFQKIKETSNKRFLKLVSVLSFEIYLQNELIMNINYDEDKFFIVFDGQVFVYRQSFYEKEMKLGDFCNYLNYIQKRDEKQYLRLINQNKSLEINFEGITDNPYFYLFKDRKFTFNIEELEDIGQFGNGYVFGEMNLIRKKKKDMIVKTLTKTQVISVSKFDFNRILKTLEEKRLELLSEKFKKKFAMFKFWSMEQLVTLFNYCSYEVFHKDDYIYKQNEPSQFIYFIEKGKFEQYCNISFSWYKNYIEYIGNMKDNLINIMMSKNPENIRRLREIYDIEKENQEKKDSMIKKDEIKDLFFLNIKDIHLEKKKSVEQYVKKDNFFTIKKEEEELNKPNKILKIPILTTEMPKVIGLEEPLEFKRRFTTVKCLSGKIVAKKINIFDLLKLLLIYKEFKYDDKFLNLIIQKKVILIDTIKNHLKKDAILFEKDIDSKYNELIYQNVDDDKKVAVAKFKGWNNGFYLDNILDTSLHFFKPKSEKFIRKEKENRFNLVHDLLRTLPEKNKKKTNNTLLNLSKQKYKQPFLLTERREALSSRYNPEKMKAKIKNVKSMINKYNQNKILENKINITNIKTIENVDDYNIERKIRNPISLVNKRTLVNDITCETKKLTMSKYVSPLNISKIYGDFNKNNNFYFDLKMKKIKNKKNKDKLNNNKTISEYYSQTLYSNSIKHGYKDKNNNLEFNTISNISNKSNKLDSFNDKNSFLGGGLKEKGDNYFPSITSNTDSININQRKKKLFLIKSKLK